jgi:phytoene dehydrogenase-like protein
MGFDYDVIIVGGGHNSLVAANYLRRAGKDVLVLENQPVFGGAAVSAESFPGVPARLSRYSYLVSLFPRQIMDDLSMNVELRRRRYSSYTPVPGDKTGLLIDARDESATEESFARIGARDDYPRWVEFYTLTRSLAQALFPQLLEPMITRAEMRARVATLTGSDSAWHHLIETPIDHTISEWFSSDVVKGVVLTDGLIGTFPRGPGDDAVSKCFLYHVIGQGTGDWDVPVGGMGQVTGSLTQQARRSGVHLKHSADVESIDPGGSVRWLEGGTTHQATGRVIIAGCSPTELRRLVGQAPASPQQVEGAQVKVNLVVSRLPKLLDDRVSQEAAFGGTFHINETWTQLERARVQAEAGEIPEPIPAEIYCHSLTDPSILDPSLREAGVHTLTVFALHTPHRLIAGKPADEVRVDLQERVLASLNSVLAEPIEDLLLPTPDGGVCVETKTTIDLENALRLPGGNIFHAPLDWPFLTDEGAPSSAAGRWGVETDHANVLIGGSGASRGGGVSGIGGHNAAMAALELLDGV